MKTDAEAWAACHDFDAWIFDKMILSRRLGYLCGPVGVDVPKPGWYVVRPCVNALGMGRGARFMWIERSTDDLPLGFFWSEIFEGEHLSVDYLHGEPIMAVRGHRDPDRPLYEWISWEAVAVRPDLPHQIRQALRGTYRIMNVEYIGGKVIEVHLRGNPDFVDGYDEMIVARSGDSRPDGYIFVPAPDYNRIGFFAR